MPWCAWDEPGGTGVVTLEDVRRALAEVYRPEGIEVWLRARQARWGNRNVEEMLRDGQGAEVLAAIERLETGAYE